MTDVQKVPENEQWLHFSDENLKLSGTFCVVTADENGFTGCQIEHK